MGRKAPVVAYKERNGHAEPRMARKSLSVHDHDK